jgi:hypothetical protein
MKPASLTADTAADLPWGRPDATRTLRATVGDIAAVRQIAELAADAGAIASRGERALDAVAHLVPCDGAVLAMWDPVQWTHRRVAAFGLPEPALQYCCDPSFLSDPGYRRVRSSRIAHRRCDVPGAADNELVTKVLGPAGFGEGVTACLFHAGRYTGVQVPYTAKTVNQAFEHIKNYTSAMLCQPWTFGNLPLRIPNNVDYTTTPDNGQMVSAQGCTPITSADPQIALYRRTARHSG